MIHAFSNGTSAQLTVHLEEDLHAFVGGALRLVATKKEVSMFLADLENWAGRVFPEESQGTNGAPEVSTPEPTPLQVAPDLRFEVLDEVTKALENVLIVFTELKPTAAELSRAVDGVSREVFAEAVNQAAEMVPPELKPVFDLVRAL